MHRSHQVGTTANNIVTDEPDRRQTDTNLVDRRRAVVCHSLSLIFGLVCRVRYASKASASIAHTPNSSHDDEVVAAAAAAATAAETVVAGGRIDIHGDQYPFHELRIILFTRRD